MALTMTRTRTQTALNKLASGLAEVNGELPFLDSLQRLRKDRQVAAAARRGELLRLRDALHSVIRRRPGAGPRPNWRVVPVAEGVREEAYREDGEAVL